MLSNPRSDTFISSVVGTVERRPVCAKNSLRRSLSFLCQNFARTYGVNPKWIRMLPGARLILNHYLAALDERQSRATGL